MYLCMNACMNVFMYVCVRVCVCLYCMYVYVATQLRDGTLLFDFVYQEFIIGRRVLNFSIPCEKCSVKSFQLHVHINAISVNYHKATPLQSFVQIKLCCSLFISKKNGNEYDEDLETEIHPVTDTCELYKYAGCQNVLKNKLSSLNGMEKNE